MSKYFAVLDVIISSDFQKLKIVNDINDDFKKSIKKNNIPYLSIQQKTLDHHKEMIYTNVIIPYYVDSNEINMNYLGLQNITFESQPQSCYPNFKSDLSVVALAKTHCFKSFVKLFKLFETNPHGYKVLVKKIVPFECLKLYYSDGSITKNDGSNHASYAVAELNFDINSTLIESMTNQACSCNIYTEVIENGTNNIGELSGLYRAIREAKKYGTDNVVVITCDSEYSIRSMREYIFNWLKNDFKSNGKDIKNIELIKDMWNTLVELKQDNIVAIRWIRGHSKDPFNELCDIEAKKVLGIS